MTCWEDEKDVISTTTAVRIIEFGCWVSGRKKEARAEESTSPTTHTTPHHTPGPEKKKRGMRKSSRAKKPVDFYVPLTVVHKEKIAEEEGEGEGEEGNHGHMEEEEDYESSSDEKEQKSFNVKQSTSGKSKAKAGAEKAHTKGKELTKNSLFDGFQNRKSATSFIEKWISTYRGNRVAAMAEMLNFLVMVAGAGSKRWVQHTVDIDGLTAEEFEELLSEPINHIRAHKSPLFIFGATQKSQAARESFKFLWQSLTTKLLTLPDRVKILSCITEIFLSLSVSSSVSLRDAVTEASLAFGNILLKATVDLRVKDAESHRQLSATNRGTGAKQKSILSMSKDTQKALRELDEMITAIFTTIFVSRSKDVLDNIRHRCLFYLGEWMKTDPERWFDDDYFKYIGWMASDRSTSVRLEAVEVLTKLLEKTNYIPRLIAFTERFILRFIEMAVGDIEETVSFAAVKLMRKLQQCGLLDQVDQTALDLVDRIVFDSSSSSRVRGESFAFMMDHTEGFDDDPADVDDDLSPTGKKRKKSLTSSQRSSQDNNEVKTLARRKKIAIQLETLAEFADHHLRISRGGNLDYVNLLSEACLSKRPGILRDWSTIFALLLRDSDSRLMLKELDQVQLSIIFRLCAQSAASLKQKIYSTSEEIDNSLAIHWQNLQDSLQVYLIPMLTRFRSEETHLEVVLELLECFDLTSIEGKALQSLVKSCTELFETLQLETSLSKMGKVVRFWTSNQSKQQKVVIAALKPLLNNAWTKILDTIHEITSNSDEGLKQKRGRGPKRNEMSSNLLHDMIPATRKFVAMWRCIDCRPLLTESATDISSSIAEANQILLHRLQSQSSEKDLIETLTENLGHTIFNVLLWETRDIYMRTTALKDEVETEEIPHDESQIQTILDVRTALLEVLESWMDLGGEDMLESRQLQCQAFRMIGDLRKLFPLRESNYHVVDQLAWHPSEEISSKLGKVFSTEESRIRERLDALGESEKDQAQAEVLSRELVENLLWPISGQMYDMENLHRRQAAAVLNYIIDPNEDVQRLIRAWIKSMKDTNFAKYLEAIVVALKHSYEDNVGKTLAKLISSHLADTELEQDEEELFGALNENLELTMQLATKLSQTLGVGKLKSPMKELLISFFHVGLKQAFTEIQSIGFLRVLEVFMKLLPDSSLVEVGKFYDDCLDNISEEMKTFLEGHLNVGGQVAEFLNSSLQSFTSHLANIISGGKTKRTIATIFIAPSFEGRKKKILSKSLVSPTVVAIRPSKISKQKNSYQELSSNESEEEEEEEEDEEEEEVKPNPKRGRFVATTSSRQPYRPRPSNISTISELTQESYDNRDHLDEINKEDDESNTSSPMKKTRHTFSISSPIHQRREEEVENEVVGEEEGVDAVLGLHLEDFGTDIEQDLSIPDRPVYNLKEIEKKKLDEEFDALPSRRRR